MNSRLQHVRSAQWIVAITVSTCAFNVLSVETNAVAVASTVHKIEVTSPVQYFRELLAMGPGERERALSKESAEKKQIILAKIKEYDWMSPDERELRLRMTQMRWYLVPLLKSSVAERVKLLSRIPSEDRPLIERRLRMWDQIPVQVQREFLENELHLGYLLKWHGSTAAERSRLLESFPSGRREKLERELDKWNSLPEERRNEMASRFNQFFELDEREKSKIIETLPQVDREQLQRAIKALEHIPADQRKQYLMAYNRFAEMSAEERKQFLKNAERWETMPETERNAYRELVRRAPAPPLPPPLGEVRPPFPPPGTPIASTNGQK